MRTRKPTEIEEIKDPLSVNWYSAMGNLSWTQYAIRCKIFTEEELIDITNLLEGYAKRGKEKAK